MSLSLSLSLYILLCVRLNVTHTHRDTHIQYVCLWETALNKSSPIFPLQLCKNFAAHFKMDFRVSVSWVRQWWSIKNNVAFSSVSNIFRLNTRNSYSIWSQRKKSTQYLQDTKQHVDGAVIHKFVLFLNLMKNVKPIENSIKKCIGWNFIKTVQYYIRRGNGCRENWCAATLISQWYK